MSRTLSRVGTAEVAAWVRSVTQGHSSGLDFGCGLGAYTRHMACDIKDGIDSFAPYIEAARIDPENVGCAFVCGDMRRFDEIFMQPHSVALFVDSLEHIAKADAIDLLKRCQIRFDKIAMLVPIGVHEQEPCDGNEAQRHLSTWYGEDLEALGFSAQVDPNFHTGNPPETAAAALAVWTR